MNRRLTIQNAKQYFSSVKHLIPATQHLHFEEKDAYKLLHAVGKEFIKFDGSHTDEFY